MEEISRGVGTALSHAGPEWVTAIGIVLILAWAARQALPGYDSRANQRLQMELDREKRKAQESVDRAERERDNSRLQGRWLEQYEHATQVQEQTNAVMHEVSTQMNVLNATLSDSKQRSREMAVEMHEMHEHLLGGTD